MTRATVIAAHVVAVPAAALLSAALALAIPSHRAVDIQMHDTYFVVAHLYFATFVGGACAVVLGLAVRLWTAMRRHE